MVLSLPDDGKLRVSIGCGWLFCGADYRLWRAYIIICCHESDLHNHENSYEIERETDISQSCWVHYKFIKHGLQLKTHNRLSGLLPFDKWHDFIFWIWFK